MKRPLTPKQIAKRWQDHRFAVLHLARHRAKKAVVAEMKNAGLRVSLVKPAAITAQAMVYLAANRERLIAEAEQTVATSPLFVKYRKPDEPEFIPR